MNLEDRILIAYDGDCPFCQSYVRMKRLKELGLHVELCNLRDYPDLIAEMRAKGMEPNEGIFVRYGGREYFADDAMMMIESMSVSSGVLGAFFKWSFASKKRAKIIYPILKFGRACVLGILRVPKI